jgi:hypothetical protein
MSDSIALMRFKDTGTILMGIYDGTCDILCSYMYKPEFFMDEDGTFSVFSKRNECFKLDDHYDRIEPEYTDDEVSDVEIWSDYGGTFWWEGKAVEKYGYILPMYIDPWRLEYDETERTYLRVCDLVDGEPDWVREFLDKLHK